MFFSFSSERKNISSLLGSHALMEFIFFKIKLSVAISGKIIAIYVILALSSSITAEKNSPCGLSYT